MQLQQLADTLPGLTDVVLDDPLWGAAPVGRLEACRAAAAVALTALTRLDLRDLGPVCPDVMCSNAAAVFCLLRNLYALCDQSAYTQQWSPYILK